MVKYGAMYARIGASDAALSTVLTVRGQDTVWPGISKMLTAGWSSTICFPRSHSEEVCQAYSNGYVFHRLTEPTDGPNTFDPTWDARPVQNVKDESKVYCKVEVRLWRVDVADHLKLHEVSVKVT